MLSDPCFSIAEMRHVPGKHNPADKATRGLTAKELVNDKEWLFDPSFLYEDPSKWPEQHFEDSKEAQEEKKVVQKTCATSAVKPLIICKMVEVGTYCCLDSTFC